MKVNRFYSKVKGLPKTKIDEDFDNIEDLIDRLEEEIKEKDLKMENQSLEDAFNSRLKIVLYQAKFRCLYILKGIVNELNNNNLPSVIPLVRTFYEIVMVIGYLSSQIKKNQDLNYLLNEPIHKILMGNRNDDAGKLAIGKVNSISILTMIDQAQKVFNAINPSGKEKEILRNVYADLSNQSHPNYNSNMLFTTFGKKGELMTLEDIGESMETVKELAYDMYMHHLTTGIVLFDLFMNKIKEDPKVKL